MILKRSNQEIFNIVVYNFNVDNVYVLFQTKLFSSIQKNGYKFMYLSARPIGQVSVVNVVTMHVCHCNG